MTVVFFELSIFHIGAQEPACYESVHDCSESLVSQCPSKEASGISHLEILSEWEAVSVGIAFKLGSFDEIWLIFSSSEQSIARDDDFLVIF